MTNDELQVLQAIANYLDKNSMLKISIPTIDIVALKVNESIVLEGKLSRILQSLSLQGFMENTDKSGYSLTDEGRKILKQ